MLIVIPGVRAASQSINIDDLYSRGGFHFIQHTLIWFSAKPLFSRLSSFLLIPSDISGKQRPSFSFFMHVETYSTIEHKCTTTLICCFIRRHCTNVLMNSRTYLDPINILFLIKSITCVFVFILLGILRPAYI